MTGTGYYDGYTPIAEYRSLLIANDQSHMDGVNNDTLRRLQKRGVQIGACAAYFDFVVPPNPRKARRQWFRDWNKALNRVLEAPSEGQPIVSGECLGCLHNKGVHLACGVCAHC